MLDREARRTFAPRTGQARRCCLLTCAPLPNTPIANVRRRRLCGMPLVSYVLYNAHTGAIVAGSQHVHAAWNHGSPT